MVCRCILIFYLASMCALLCPADVYSDDSSDTHSSASSDHESSEILKVLLIVTGLSIQNNLLMPCVYIKGETILQLISGKRGIC